MAARTDNPVAEIAAMGNVDPTKTLPNPLSSFIGREREIGEVESLLDEARLVTLLGTGGSGKTRLAIEATKRAATRLGVESAFVDLAPISDPALIDWTVATALGVRPVPPQTIAGALIEGLGRRRPASCSSSTISSSSCPLAAPRSSSSSGLLRSYGCSRRAAPLFTFAASTNIGSSPLSRRRPRPCLSTVLGQSNRIWR